ncbi:hypothetical protein KFE25_005139 [Diacronema lutheri]|uniref:Uncharacterized protein n=1 Tax=Diacronema lutheri TaxID=2081491 RepID=A0A8J5X8D0_DIALT|nr:hypothetical protein KFE25_005139 [Diacronema lutheri]
MRAGLLLHFYTQAVLGARSVAPAMSKANLPSKVCVVCNRPFTWRKKWERCWDEVSTCSKRCNGERRALNRHDRKLDADGSQSDEGPDAGESERGRASAGGGERARTAAPAGERSPDGGDGSERSSERAERKAAKLAAKEKRRLVRSGGDPTVGQKPCTLCARSVDLLIRCRTDESGEWRMVCGRCWKLPTVANGVVDGDPGTNPNYKYGGLWKNQHASK